MESSAYPEDCLIDRGKFVMLRIYGAGKKTPWMETKGGDISVNDPDHRSQLSMLIACCVGQFP